VNYGFDKVQLRIYDTDKLQADNLAACASYEPPSDDTDVALVLLPPTNSSHIPPSHTL